jgi:hypothetical protein
MPADDKLPRARLQEIFQDPARIVEHIEHFERSYNSGPPPGHANHDWVVWFRARRFLSYICWDVYTACAIDQYRRIKGESRASLGIPGGMYMDQLPTDLAGHLLAAYVELPDVPWADDRPQGYVFDPFGDLDPKSRDSYATHKLADQPILSMLNQALESITVQVENVLGYFWKAGVARFYSQKAGSFGGGYHVDNWPLGLKKIMIYPAGADADRGSTQFIIEEGRTRMIEGGPGVWAIFENSLLTHRAWGGNPEFGDRPTIEITVIPAFENSPRVEAAHIHVGYPWLPPELDQRSGVASSVGLSPESIKWRMLTRTLITALTMPDNVDLPAWCKNIGYFEAM